MSEELCYGLFNVKTFEKIGFQFQLVLILTERLTAKHAHVKKLFSSVSRMALSGLNLMEKNTVRHNRELNLTQSTTNCETSSVKCVRIL